MAASNFVYSLANLLMQFSKCDICGSRLLKMRVVCINQSTEKWKKDLKKKKKKNCQKLHQNHHWTSYQLFLTWPGLRWWSTRRFSYRNFSNTISYYPNVFFFVFLNFIHKILTFQDFGGITRWNTTHIGGWGVQQWWSLY